MTVAPWIRNRSMAREELERLVVIRGDLVSRIQSASHPIVAAAFLGRLPEVEKQIRGLRDFLA